MNTSLMTGLIAVLGSLVGSFASIATAWLTQHYQRIREQARTELRRRETLYGEFITETARVTSDAFEHSLEHPESLSTLFALLARIHLVATDSVYMAAQNCCNYVVDLYAKPNLRIDQIYERLQKQDHPLRTFAAACRTELDQYVRQ
jgi:hypothetical protein